MFQLPREGRRACLSVGCSLLLFSLLSFFRAGVSDVVTSPGRRQGNPTQKPEQDPEH